MSGADEYHGLPTPRTDARRRVPRRCGVVQGRLSAQAAVDLQALIEAGKGDVPLTKLRYRCSSCRSARPDWVVTSR